jgi:hypothetical protein
MSEDRWAQYLRLQDQHRLCRDPATADALEGAMDRELASITKGAPRRGGIATAVANHRRRRRRRLALDAMTIPLMNVTFDPWPHIDARLELQQRLARLAPSAASLLIRLASGETHLQLAAERHMPVGTIKAQAHRARLKLAA